VDAALERDNQAFNLAMDASRTESLGHDFYRDFYRGLQRLLAIRTDPQFRSRPEFKSLPQFLVEKLRAAAPKWSTQSLLEALALVTRAEFRMRTGRVAGKSPQAAELNLLLLLLKQVFASPS
jgi:DNA polymerase III delta subunit